MKKLIIIFALFFAVNAFAGPTISPKSYPSFNSLPQHSYLHKIDNASVNIAIEDSTQVRLYEDSTKDGRDPNFLVTAKEGAATYIRLVYSDVGTSGAIHWHITYEPREENGFIEVAL